MKDLSQIAYSVGRDFWKTPNHYIHTPCHLGLVEMLPNPSGVSSFKVVTKEAQIVMHCDSLNELGVCLQILSDSSLTERECAEAFYIYKQRVIKSDLNY